MFALFDYVRYRKGWGRYRPGNKGGRFPFAFWHELPQDAVNILRPGDAIFLGTANSFLAWMIMYFSDAPLSHVALYVGNERIVHATLSGVVNEPLSCLFGQNNLLIPVITPATNEQRRDFERLTGPTIGQSYSWRAIRRKAWWLTTGRDWYHFRWRYAADVALALVIIGGIMALVTGSIIVNMSLLLALYCLLIGINYIRAWRSPLSPSDTGNLLDLLWDMRTAGFRLILDAGVGYARGDLGAISTDLYVFLNGAKLPSIEQWITQIRSTAKQVTLNISLVPQQVGTATVDDAIVKISVKTSAKEIQRLGIDTRLDGFDICVRFDSSDADPPSIMASVKAAAALAAVSGGTLYNAVVKDSVITGSQALEWSRRAVAALDEYERPNARK